MLVRIALLMGLVGWCAAAAVAGDGAATVEPLGLEQCLKQDSISCVQKQVFRAVRSFFDQEAIELFGGVALVKQKGPEGARSAAEDETEANTVLAANDVASREQALESFAIRKAAGFLQERSLRLDLSPVVQGLTERARALVATIPAEVRQKVVDFAAAEGRGKKKKLKKLLPLLILGGLKIAGLAVLTFLGVGLIAKKAILVSLVSLAISGFIALKKLLGQSQHGTYHEVHESPASHGWSSGTYSSPGGSFDVSGYSAGHGEYGSHSQPVGHAVAYSAHKPGAR